MAVYNMNDDELLDLLLNAEEIPERDVYMPRFNTHFRIKALTDKKVSEIRKQCTREWYNRRGELQRETDMDRFMAMVIAEACVRPKWDNPLLLEKYKASDAAEVVQRRLLAGELVRLAEEIFDLSGYFQDTEDIKK